MSARLTFVLLWYREIFHEPPRLLLLLLRMSINEGPVSQEDND